MDKQNMVWAYNGVLFGNLKNEVLIHATKMKLENIMVSEII